MQTNVQKGAETTQEALCGPTAPSAGNRPATASEAAAQQFQCYPAALGVNTNNTFTSQAFFPSLPGTQPAFLCVSAVFLL